MVRLPDANVLGRPAFGSGRPSARYDPSAIAEGMERSGQAIQEAGLRQARSTERVGAELGRAVEEAGTAMGRAVTRGGAEMAEAIEYGGRAQARAAQSFGAGLEKIGKTLEEIQLDRDRMDFARAKADFIQRRAAIDTKYDKDTDYATMPQRYRQDLAEAADASGSLISNSRFREVFGYDVQTQAVQAARAADRQALNLERKDRLGELNERLDALRDSALVTKEDDRGRTIASAQDLIDSYAGAGYIEPGDARKLKREWAGKYAEVSLQRLPAGERVKLLQRGPQNEEEFLDRVTGAESGGKRGSRSTTSSSVGFDGFIEQTWLGTLKKHGPAELAAKIQVGANGRFFVPDKVQEQQILALREDKDLSRQMTRMLSRENAAALSEAGFATTPHNLYLAHFLGASGAVKVLGADPSTPVADLLSAKVIAANTQVLSGKTAGSVVQWAGQKMGTAGPSGSFADFIPEPRRAALLQGAQQEVQQIATANSAARSEQFNRVIIDAEAGISPLPDRSLIENDPLLTPASRNTLLKAYDSAAGDVAAFQRAISRFNDPNGGPFNPFDKNDKDSVDKIYRGLGGNPAALQRVVERTGIVPSTVATALRADAASNDPKRVAAAATLGRNLLNQNPTVFTGIAGGSDIEETAVTFAHYVDSFGMTAEQAARRIVEMNTAEYKASVKARIKTEDVDALMKKKLAIGDAEAAFDASWGWQRNPSVGFSPEARGRMFTDFGTLTKEKYLEHGDFDLAKKQAAEQLKKVWGVTNVNGSAGLTGGGVVMPYPPERAPRMAGIENPSDLIAEHAVASIKAETGQDVERKNLRLDVIPGITPGAFKAGAPVPYALSWSDRNGTVHMLNPGRAFVVDPAQLHEMQTRKRKEGLEARQRTPYDPFAGSSNVAGF